MIPFNALLNVVKESKDLIYAASAFMKSILFLPLNLQNLLLLNFESMTLSRCYASRFSQLLRSPIFEILNNYKADAPVFRNNYMASDLSKDIRKNHPSLVIGHLY